MTFYHIEFAKTGHGMSGGESWMINIIKRLSDLGHKNILFTTDNGRETYEKLGLTDGENVEYRTINSYKMESSFGPLVSCVLRTFQASKLVLQTKIARDSYLVCHSDFFPNTIPFMLSSGKVSVERRISMIHIVCPKLFCGYENHFIGGFKLPTLRFIHHKLNQLMCFWILRKVRSTILSINENNSQLLRGRCPNNKIITLKHFAATDVKNSTRKPKKDTDIVWVGRFQKLKGLLDLPDIILKVKESIPDVSVVVVGGGDESIWEKFSSKINKLGLENNVKYAGFVTGEEKDRLIERSRVFAMTSHYESYSIVVLEAMKLNTPMVAYKLPSYKPYYGGAAFVPMFDTDQFADKISALLTNSREYESLTGKVTKKAKSFSWDKTISEFLEAVNLRYSDPKTK